MTGLKLHNEKLNKKIIIKTVVVMLTFDDYLYYINMKYYKTN